jgi:hypothetical protein
MLKVYEKCMKMMPGTGFFKLILLKFCVCDREWQPHNPLLVTIFKKKCDISLIRYISKGLLSLFVSFNCYM